MPQAPGKSRKSQISDRSVFRLQGVSRLEYSAKMDAPTPSVVEFRRIRTRLVGPSALGARYRRDVSFHMRSSPCAGTSVSHCAFKYARS